MFVNNTDRQITINNPKSDGTLAPILSNIMPLTGISTPVAKAPGIVSKPVSKGENPKPFCRKTGRMKRIPSMVMLINPVAMTDTVNTLILVIRKSSIGCSEVNSSTTNKESRMPDATNREIIFKEVQPLSGASDSA